MGAVRWGLWALVVLVTQAPHVRGDAIVVSRAMKASTIAEVFVEDGAVRVELEVGIPDLEAFKNLLPDDLLTRMGIDAGSLEERLPTFFREDLTVRLDGGPPLAGYVTFMEGRRRVQRDEITGAALPAGNEERDVVIAATLVYPFGGRPDTLALTPPSSESGRTAASVGFMAYHRGLPVNDFRYLNQESTIDLDWDDPWYSRFRNRNLWRQYNEPINAFLYIEPYEVRVEVIARPQDLQQWVDLGVTGMDTLPVELQDELKQAVAAFLAEHVHLTVDGQEAQPALNRINFLRRTLRTSRVIDPPEPLDLHSATLGVIFVLPTMGLPQEAALTWDLFSPKQPVVRAAATDEAGPMPYKLMPDDNVLKWTNFLKNPTIPKLVDIEPLGTRTGVRVSLPSLLCLLLGLPVGIGALRSGRRALLIPAGVLLFATVALWPVGQVALANPLARLAPIPDEDAGEVVEALLRNVYVSFDFRDENTIYDALARSVTGRLLTQIYLETQQSLELQSQGGARVKVKEVDLLDITPEPLKGETGFTAACTWTVRGSVGHWGHIHQRINQYRARITVKPVDGEWKITDLEVQDEQRIS